MNLQVYHVGSDLYLTCYHPHTLSLSTHTHTHTHTLYFYNECVYALGTWSFRDREFHGVFLYLGDCSRFLSGFARFVGLIRFRVIV